MPATQIASCAIFANLFIVFPVRDKAGRRSCSKYRIERSGGLYRDLRVHRLALTKARWPHCFEREISLGSVKTFPSRARRSGLKSSDL